MLDRDDREYQADFDTDEQSQQQAPRYAIAQGLARKLLAQYKLTSIPIDIDELIRLRGVSLAKVEADAKLSGQLYAAIPEIVINCRNRSPARQRFTAAHELGHWEMKHYLLGELPPDTLGYSGIFEGDGSAEGRGPLETEANAFAAEILMPSAQIKKLKKPIPLNMPQQLAKQYAVSEQAMFYQLMRCRMF